MRKKSPFLIVFVALSSLFVLAQKPSTLSTLATCGVSDQHLTVTVDDRPSHTLTLARRVCQWQQPLVMAGSQGREYTTIGVDDVKDADAQDQGYVVGTLADGDRYFLRYEGGSTRREGHLKLTGTWIFTGGTGKLTGLTGKGVYTGTPTPDGGMIFEMQGEYLIGQ